MISKTKKKALWFGINAYPAPNQLAGCVNDANDLPSRLVSIYGFARSDIQVISDADASRRGILDARAQFLTGAQKGDVLVIGFSGHGTYVGDTSGDETDQYDEAIVPHDFQYAGLIVDDEQREQFGNIAAGVHLDIFSDSCHSGTVTRVVMLDHILPGIFGKEDQRKSWRVRFLSPDPKWMPQCDEQILETPWPGKSKRSLTQASMNHLGVFGCKNTQYSYDAKFGGRANGAMSYACMQVMEERGPSLTYSQLVREMNVKLKAWGFPQEPQLEGKSSDKRRRLFS